MRCTEISDSSVVTRIEKVNGVEVTCYRDPERLALLTLDPVIGRKIMKEKS